MFDRLTAIMSVCSGGHGRAVAPFWIFIYGIDISLIVLFFGLFSVALHPPPGNFFADAIDYDVFSFTRLWHLCIMHDPPFFNKYDLIFTIII